MKILELIAPYNKAIVALVVGLILTALANFGINGDTTVKDALAVIVTAVLVYVVPNKKVGGE
jgi:hypothetical protein